MIQFQETYDDFFSSKESSLFRRQQLRHSMDAFDSVAGNIRRSFFFKRVNVFFFDNSYDIQWYAFGLVPGNIRRFFFFKRVNVFFVDNSDDIQWMQRRLFLLQKSQRLFRRKQLRHHFNGCTLICDFSK